MRLVVGLVGLIAVAACQAPLDTGTTSQLAVIVKSPPAFGTVQVGQSSAPVTILINPGPGANDDEVDAITESCPDFSIDAEGLPAEVYRICTTTCNGNPAPLQCVPQLVGCQTEDSESYAFSATFTPTVAGPLSCVVTISLDGGGTTQQITLSGTGMAPPVQISVSPPSLAFGDVRAGTESSPATVTVRDLGGSALVVQSATVSGAYGLSGPSSFTVQPGASQGLAVSCFPGAVGETDGALTISSNDPANGTVTVPLTCNGVTSSLAISPSPATLPTTRVGEPIERTISLTNAGGAATTIESIALAGADLALVGTPSLPVALGSGSTISVDVAFDAAIHGAASGTLTVVTSDETRTSQIAATALLATMSLSPDGNIDLGPVCATAMASQTFTIVGNGDGPFAITGLSTPDAPFTLDAPSLPAHVAPSGGNQVTFSVDVAPTDAGEATSAITVTTDIPADAPHVIQLAALGLPAGTSATPTALDLGSSPIDTTTIGQPIQITNCSADPLDFTNPRIEGSDAGEFAIVAQPPGSAIAADASATWLVVLSARTEGLKQAQFSVDTAAGTTSVPLTGEGVSADGSDTSGGSGSGLDSGGDDATSGRNYYTCSTGGAGGSAPIGLGIALAVAARRAGRARRARGKRRPA